MTRPVVLTLCDYYRPGFRAGGTVRTLEAIVSLLNDEFEFAIVTRDRDLGSRQQYQSIRTGEWERLGSARVMYMSGRETTPVNVRNVIQSTRHDILYLNSLFSLPFSVYPLWLRRLGFVGRSPVILAPRGEISPGALGIKRFRKDSYIELSRRCGLYDGVLWQASSQLELEDIRRSLGARSQVFVAPDLALETSSSAQGASFAHRKEPAKLQAVFLSRISRKKNLIGALDILGGVQGHVQFTIYGPIEDATYWHQCQRAISRLPSNVAVSYGGELSPDRVPDVLSSNDLLLLPTLGENHGHVILEALSAGCPVLISDRTPWRRLEELGVGWDVPLARPDEFRRILDQCVAMDSSSWGKISAAAAAYGVGRRRDPKIEESNRALFRACLHRSEKIGPAVEANVPRL